MEKLIQEKIHKMLNDGSSVTLVTSYPNGQSVENIFTLGAIEVIVSFGFISIYVEGHIVKYISNGFKKKILKMFREEYEKIDKVKHDEKILQILNNI